MLLAVNKSAQLRPRLHQRCHRKPSPGTLTLSWSCSETCGFFLAATSVSDTQSRVLETSSPETHSKKHCTSYIASHVRLRYQMISLHSPRPVPSSCFQTSPGFSQWEASEMQGGRGVKVSIYSPWRSAQAGWHPPWLMVTASVCSLSISLCIQVLEMPSSFKPRA